MQGIGDAELRLGGVAGEDDLSMVAENAVELRVAHLVELAAGDHQVGVDPDAPGNGLRGETVVAGHDHHADAGLMAAADRVGHFGPGCVEQAHESDETEIALGFGAGRGRRLEQLAPSDGEDAQAGGRTVGHVSFDRRPPHVVQGQLASVRLENGGAASQHRFGGAFGVHPNGAVEVVDGGHQLQRGVETEHRSARLLAGHPGDVGTEPLRREQHRGLGRVADGGTRVRAVDHRRGTTREHDRERTGDESTLVGDVAARRLEVDVAGGGPQRYDMHAVLGERPGLVGTDHRRRTQRLHGTEPFDECALAREHADADAECERDRRQEPFGHVAHQQADREHRRGRERQARGERSQRKERETDGDRDDGDDPRDPSDLPLQRALVGLACL